MLYWCYIKSDPFDRSFMMDLDNDVQIVQTCIVSLDCNNFRIISLFCKYSATSTE